MIENDHSQENKKNTTNKKENIKNSSIINPEKEKKSENNKRLDTSNYPNTDKTTKSLKKRWHDFSIQDKVQMVLAFLTFFTLITYIWFSIDQGRKTRESINLTIQSTEFDLRAYCILNPTVIFFNTERGQKPYVTFTIKNLGKTPAYKVGITSLIGISYGTPSRSEINTPLVDAFIIGSGEVSAEQIINASFVINNEIFNDMVSGNGKLVLLVRISYQDIFKKNRISYFGANYDVTSRKAFAIPGFAYAN